MNLKETPEFQKVYAEEIFPYQDLNGFILKSLQWARQFSHYVYFHPAAIQIPYGTFPHALAVGVRRKLETDFAGLQEFYEANRTWLFGYLSYELKNDFESLLSKNHDRIGFDKLFFFEPLYILFFENNKIKILSAVEAPEEVLMNISLQVLPHTKAAGRPVRLHPNVSKNSYVRNVNQLKKHIEDGDIYEVNYCMEFFAESLITPTDIFNELQLVSPAPFALLSRFNDHYVMGCSPERFLKKTGNKLISQPMKGTSPRYTNPVEDEKSKHYLRSSDKERAENMMITDLVRNDLAKSSVPGSVQVEELFGVYSYARTHQMVSTVSSTLKDHVHFTDALRNAFPMGSMTGAPKIEAMKIIDKYEVGFRGLFSGSMGYINPLGDFDFNVVIRSTFYNAKTSTISLQAGSAITFDSDPEKEYEECMAKAQAILNVLQGIA